MPDPEAVAAPSAAVEAVPLTPRAPSSKPRMLYLDHLKAFLAFSVIYHHCSGVCTGIQSLGDMNIALEAVYTDESLNSLTCG